MLDHDAVYNYIKNNNYTTTKQICDAFMVSEPTARRAFAALAAQNKIVRVHGGAMIPVMNNPIPTAFDRRCSLNHDTKSKIAREASKIIQPLSTIILLGGTTVLSMCPFIYDMNITVVTNSLLVLGTLKYTSNIRLILLGGLYNPREEEVGGVFSNKSLSSVRADFVFMGTSGFDEKHGFSTADPAVDLYTMCLETSVASCVLTDSSKYMRGGMSITARPSQISFLFTDNGLPASACSSFQNQGVTVTLVE